MGHRPKCLLQLDGLSLLERQLQALTLAGVNPIGVVLGHHAERILQEEALARWAAQPVRNPQPDDGHVSSLRILRSARLARRCYNRVCKVCPATQWCSPAR